MDTRDRLVESTRELLWERGYTATSPKAIQERAGAGQGSMYHHFEGKADLAATAMAETAAELLARSERALEGPGTAYERLVRYYRLERDVQRGCRVGRLVQEPEVVESDRLRAPLSDAFAAIRRRIAAVVAEGQVEGSVRGGVPPEVLAAMLMAVVQGGYVTARAARSDEPFEAAVTAALALLAP